MASVSTTYSQGTPQFIFITLWRQTDQEQAVFSCDVQPVATQSGQAKKALFERYFFLLEEERFSCEILYQNTHVAKIEVEQGQVMISKTADADRLKFHVYDKKFAQI